VRAGRELVRHPLRGLRTLAMAVRDAAAPGEALSFCGRLKTVGQALAGLALAHGLRSGGVRHLHCHFAHSPASVGMYAAAQLGIGFSFTGHANDLFQRRALLKRKLERARFVACISQWHRAMYSSIEPGRAERYRLIRCGVDTQAWQAQDRRAHVDMRDDPLRVLSVCRLVEKKGIDTLIRAVSLARGGGLACRLTIAGDGPDAAWLRGLAHELGAASQIEWLGAVDNERVRQLLAEVDIFALPCRTDSHDDRDGIPVVLMEAMACGVPVVSGDLPAIRELIEHDRNGLLVEGADAQTLAGMLHRLAEDSALRRRLGAAGRCRVEEEFSLDLNVGRLEEALLQSIGMPIERHEPLELAAAE
jgi:colanic acid/amylovoran biosynthesis glycosyltransferase